ncbi:MAG TPA: hypothetical protein VFG10_05260 [Saprospiraceae bacterium]|nr:hypothetical protein [Saprospiraceae bacterium]
MKIFSLLYIACIFASCLNPGTPSVEKTVVSDSISTTSQPSPDSSVLTPVIISLDTALYENKMLQLVHQNPNDKWPVKTPYPLPGALLPFNRIIAYYGNLYSKDMGILGELPPDEVLSELQKEVNKWSAADTSTPVIPALHYIAVTAQKDPGAGKKYRLRMPFNQIDKILEMAQKIDAIVFLDIQVGHSSLEEEIPNLEPYLLMPNVHLGIDPEFSMKNRKVPSSSIGTFDAADINYATGYLAQLVKDHHLPPKILVVHRFTRNMLTNYEDILTQPEVQIVMDMDGFGFPAKKITTYNNSVAKEPVQFTGFKIFYKNDTEDRKWPEVMQPAEVLALYPVPVYIQYQ